MGGTHHSLSCRWEEHITVCLADGRNTSQFVLQMGGTHHSLSCRWEEHITVCLADGRNTSQFVLQMGGTHHSLSCRWEEHITVCHGATLAPGISAKTVKKLLNQLSDLKINKLLFSEALISIITLVSKI